MPTNPEYLVVGGGTAGCVVAARLAEHGASVTLFEAGTTGSEATNRTSGLFQTHNTVLVDTPGATSVVLV